MEKPHLSICSRLHDLLEIGKQLEIPLNVLDKETGTAYIDKLFRLYSPLRTWGHVQLGVESCLSPAEKYQYAYAKTISKQPLYVVFDQGHKEDRQWVLEIQTGRDLSRLMEENGILEYFLSDAQTSFCVAVNWYAIEYVGDIAFDEDMNTG